MPRRKLTDAEKFQRKLNKQKKNEAESIERDLKDILRKRIPEPAYFHEIGDRVNYGAWKYTEILDILDDGKFYKCFSCTKHNVHCVPTYDTKIHYETWYNLGFYKTEWPDRIEEDDDIIFNYSQRDIAGLLSMMSRQYGIDLNPDYQRGNVWALTQKVALIDSIFKNIDIGKITIIKRPWGDNPHVPATPLLYEMLDGKQRLTAIWEFYTSRFKYKGLYFHELCIKDRNHFKHYKTNYSETEPLTNEQKYRYFLKLNTTGIPVDTEHLKKVKQLWIKSQSNS